MICISWKIMSLSLFYEICINKEATWLLVSHGCKILSEKKRRKMRRSRSMQTLQLCPALSTLPLRFSDNVISAGQLCPTLFLAPLPLFFHLFFSLFFFFSLLFWFLFCLWKVFPWNPGELGQCGLCNSAPGMGTHRWIHCISLHSFHSFFAKSASSLPPHYCSLLLFTLPSSIFQSLTFLLLLSHPHLQWLIS